ncbi:MAG: hypothetical protein K2P14_10985 [Anaeroplasmataceae bacterium]|nr:hypothetical protein [Anaeroplasmataceae bacterium]
MIPSLLSGGSTSSTVTAADWSSLITSVTAQFSVVNIVQVMSTIIVAGIGFVFLWWGARKAYRALMSAVRRGKTGF